MYLAKCCPQFLLVVISLFTVERNRNIPIRNKPQRRKHSFADNMKLTACELILNFVRTFLLVWFVRGKPTMTLWAFTVAFSVLKLSTKQQVWKSLWVFLRATQKLSQNIFRLPWFKFTAGSYFLKKVQEVICATESARIGGPSM